MKMGIAGKGGSGKTTFSAMIVNHLLKHNKGPILAVDGDPNYNLGELLGFKEVKTLMEVEEQLMRKKGDLPAGVNKQSFWEIALHEVIAEGKGVDLLAMGRTEGPGCYCSANNLLRLFIERLEKNYPFVVIDNEAGMEHLSRRTTRKLDILFVVANFTPVSLKSAERIWKIATEMEIEIREKRLIMIELIKDTQKQNLNYFTSPVGVIPYDETITTFATSERPLLDLPLSNPAQRETGKILSEQVHI
ncbi:MAG TPA: carbon monoxide dehydrogenase [Candidatus Omnitrophica bacterium]|nr:carbon monoxide dehydrogenase [Candidatus Omnitrophota bacterium]